MTIPTTSETYIYSLEEKIAEQARTIADLRSKLRKALKGLKKIEKLNCAYENWRVEEAVTIARKTLAAIAAMEGK